MAYISVLVIALVLDQLTKAWIVGNFTLYGSKTVVPGFFDLVYVTNTGAAFSMFADIDSPLRHYGFLVIGLLAVVILSAMSWKMKASPRLYPVAFGLIAGGALGNVIDRIRYGAVIDFLDFYLGKYHWPAFNVADSAICVGVGLFMVTNFLEAKHKE